MSANHLIWTCRDCGRREIFTRRYLRRSHLTQHRLGAENRQRGEVCFSCCLRCAQALISKLLDDTWADQAIDWPTWTT